MDKYIKYPLLIDKSKIDWNADYMRYGGSQLIEILEKEFPLEYLKKNKRKLDINDFQLERLEIWLKNNCDVESIKKELNINSLNTAKSFFYRGTGLLPKLYRRLDLTPVIEVENGEFKFKSRFSFIDYDVIQNKGIMVISKIVENKWCDSRVTNYDRAYMTKVYFYKERNGKLVQLPRTHPIAIELFDAYNVLRKLSEN